uniref:Pollen-specific leucine-rich repeat extensin-like protein 3 n=1 Tax=Hirondellea gigas TaxID=1518452 RepID=A0A2P2HZX7_9CRUS
MKVSLLVLGVALLCVAAVGAQVAPRGRERLRELVQKARAGDIEAQTILASRRRKIIRNKEGGGRSTIAREQSAVQSILGGAAPSVRRPNFQTTLPTTEAPRVRSRLPLRSRQRSSRNRGGSRASQTEVTTFRPRFTQRFTTTEAPIPAPVKLSPVPISHSIFTTEETFSPPHIDLTPTNSVPSMFQSAQFGAGGRGVQAVSTISRQSAISKPAPSPTPKQLPLRPTPVQRAPIEEVAIETAAPQHVDLTPTAIVPSMFQSAQFGQERSRVQATNTITRPATRPVSRPRSRLRTVPHRAIQRGLETGRRSEIIPAQQDAEPGATPRPVQTTRRYSYFDAEGNYVFGYESDDGSFKEEIRGTDCIVNGKYGYVDPDGIRREFTYVSGNRCDHNPDANLNVDGVAAPVHDQFLHQTKETALTDVELSALAFNRRRRPVKPQERAVPQRTTSSRKRISRPRSRAEAVQQTRQEVEVAPVDLTPSNVIPSMFQPAQFRRQEIAKPAKPSQDRFPVPDFLSSKSKRPRTKPTRQPESPRRQEAPRRQEEPQQPIPSAPKAQPEQAPHIDLTPSQVIPSMFQPAQFGPGGRGVQAQETATRPPLNFNFEQEFRSVFSHFDNTGAPRPVARPAPRPTTTPRPRPTTRPPTTRAPVTNAVPSLFQPAQFGGQQAVPAMFQPAQFRQQPARPAPTQAPVSFEDNSLTLSSQSKGAQQLVFDASTGTFRTVHLQATNHFGTPGPLPTQPPRRIPTQPPRPTTRPRPRTTPAPTPPPRQHFTPQTTGRPLFGTGASAGGRNPLPPIPTSAAEFDRFFAQFPSSG